MNSTNRLYLQIGCLCLHSETRDFKNEQHYLSTAVAAAAAAESLQSCPTLCDPIDGSPPGSPVPGILQARTLESVAISFSNAWKWKVKGKSLSRVQLLATPWTAAHQPLRPWDFPGKSTGVGCHCLLRFNHYVSLNWSSPHLTPRFWHNGRIDKTLRKFSWCILDQKIQNSSISTRNQNVRKP